ncbi:MAG TPA: hypothetical protein VK666_14220 [Chryseolinea sp.]|nr:hypothetical protein [Chryseolinea sp.]
MHKRIIKIFISFFVSTLIISSCEEDDGVPYTYTSQVDLKSSSIVDDQHKSVLLYSIDDGATFVDYPDLKVGQAYKVKVIIRKADTPDKYLTADQFAFDWTGSDPAPADASADMPQFTLGESNNVKVKIIDKHCPFVASSWVGDWIGFENGACCGGHDELTIEQDPDPAKPNRLIISNFWADGPAVKVFVDFSPSTNYFDQLVDMPEQETSEEGTASGSGTYDQCAGTLQIATTYTIDGDTYEWNYELSRE